MALQTSSNRLRKAGLVSDNDSVDFFLIVLTSSYTTVVLYIRQKVHPG